MSKISQIAEIIAGLTYGEMVELASALNDEVKAGSGLFSKGVDTKEMLHQFAKKDQTKRAQNVRAAQAQAQVQTQATGGFGSQQGQVAAPEPGAKGNPLPPVA
jgi:hypothetical protein